MNPEDQPVVRPGRVTLTATYDGEGDLHGGRGGPQRVVILLDVRRGDHVIATDEIVPFSTEFESLDLQGGMVLQFVANVAVRRVKDGYYYKMSRHAKFRVLPPSKVDERGRLSPRSRPSK